MVKKSGYMEAKTKVIKLNVYLPTRTTDWEQYSGRYQTN